MNRVQLVGTQRSGSNLLRLMLGQLQEVFAPPSAHELRDFQSLASQYGDLSKPRNAASLASDVGTLIDINALPWPPFPDRTERILQELFGASLAHMIVATYDAYARFYSAGCWVSKCLENIYYADQIEATKVPMIFVHLIRDPRAVAASFASAPIGPKDPRAIALSWRDDQLACMQVRAIVGDSRWVEVRYEDLLERPRGALEKLCRLANIEWSDEAMSFHRSKAASTAANLSTLWTNLDRPIDRGRISAYRSQLSEDAVRAVELITSDLMQDFGYTPDISNSVMLPNEEERKIISESDKELKLRARESRDMNSEDVHLRRERFLQALKERLQG